MSAPAPGDALLGSHGGAPQTPADLTAQELSKADPASIGDKILSWVSWTGPDRHEPFMQIQVSNVILQLLRSERTKEDILEIVLGTFERLSAESAHPQVLGIALLEVLEAVKFVGDDLSELGSEITYDAAVAEKAEFVVRGSLELIGRARAALVLSSGLLNDLGLHPTPRAPEMLQRGLVKLTTSTYFKQRTTNLLRESSEGFSRLIVLLTGPDVLLPESVAEDDEERSARAKRAWQAIERLIGHFGLAPIRVVDLILEIASCNITHHWRVFIEILQHGSYGPLKKLHADSTGDNLDSQIGGVSSCLDTNSGDDETIARALSFRYRWYKNADNGEMPPGMLFLTAFLVKYGFVRPGLLLSSLSPDEDGMDEIREKYKAVMSSRSGPANALTMTVLVDDDDTSSSTPADQVVEAPKPQAALKIQLLHALLAIGEPDFSLYLVSKYPWTIMAYPMLSSLIARNVRKQVEGLYNQTIRLPLSHPYHLGASDMALTQFSPPPPATVEQEFFFFYGEWAKHIEPWTDAEDIYRKGEKWLSLLQGLGGRESALMAKICRLIVNHFSSVKEEEQSTVCAYGGQLQEPYSIADDVLRPWRGLIRSTLLPALSISDHAQASFDNELQEVFNYLSWEQMAAFFGEWRDVTTNLKARNSLLPAAHAAAKTTRDIKQALARVTKAQSNPDVAMGGAITASDRGPARALAKHGHSNPLALWSTANTQVKSYGSVGNIGEYFMDVARYSGDISKSVAVFTWVDSFASDKNPKAIDNLAVFVGLINRSFKFDLRPLLKHIIQSLRSGEQFALTIFEQLLSGMSGEDIIENYAISNDQLTAFACGPEMIRETFYTSEIVCKGFHPRRTSTVLSQIDKSVPRLMAALVQNKFAIPILLGLARFASTLKDDEVPVKPSGDEKDHARNVFHQFCNFLAERLPANDRASLIPRLSSLSDDLGIESQLCWAILRLKFGPFGARDPDAHAPKPEAYWEEQIAETVAYISSQTEGAVSQLMDERFMFKFNTLRVSDIMIASEAYTKAKTHIDQLSKKVVITPSKPGAVITSNDRSREVGRLTRRAAVLKQEHDKQDAHVEEVRKALLGDSALWFSKSVESGREGTIQHFLHDECFYRRAIQSPADALFVAKFIRMCHDFNVPGFSTANAYNLFFQDRLAAKIYECTESEAYNLGRCLFVMMSDLDGWYQDKTKYYKEALDGEPPDDEAKLPEYPLRGMYSRPTPDVPKQPMSWENFKNLYAKLHNNLTTALKACLTEPTYEAPKNAVIVALQLLPFYPIMSTNARVVEEGVKRVLSEPSTPPETKPAFNSYLSQLTLRKKERPTVAPENFHPAALIRKRKADAAARAKAEADAEAKAKADAEAKAAAAANAEEEADKIEKTEGMDIDASADATASPVKEPTPPNPTPSMADAKALRAKLEQGRAAREAKRSSAASPAAPTPSKDASLLSRDDATPGRDAPTPSKESLNVHPDRLQGLVSDSKPAEAGSAQQSRHASMPPPKEMTNEEARAEARARKERDRRGGDRRDERHREDPREERRGDSRGDRNGREERLDGRDSRDPRDERERRGERRDPRDERRERDGDRRRERERGDERRREEPGRERRRGEERYREERARDERPRERSRDRGSRRADSARASPAPSSRRGGDSARASPAPSAGRHERDAREATAERRERGARDGERRGTREPTRDAPSAASAGGRTPRTEEAPSRPEMPRLDSGRQDPPHVRGDRRGQDSTGNNTPRAEDIRSDRTPRAENHGRRERTPPRPSTASAIREEPTGEATPPMSASARGRGGPPTAPKTATPEMPDRGGRSTPRESRRERTERERGERDRGVRQQEPPAAEERRHEPHHPGRGGRELLPGPFSAPAGGNSLAARMGLAPMAPPPVQDRRRDDTRDRKRPLDDERGGPSSREGSPGTKRRRGRREGGAGNRLLAGAMRAASASQDK